MLKPRTLAVVAALVLCAFSYGVAVGAYQIFPFFQLSAVKRLVVPAHLTEEVNRPDRVALFAALGTQADLVLLGDSLTEAGPWGELLGAARVANRGIGGDTTADILARLDPILSGQVGTVLVMAGINDISRGMPVPQVAARHERIAAQLVAAGIDVVLQSTIQCDPARCGAGMAAKIAALNRVLPDVARKAGAAYLPLEGLSDPGGLPPGLSHDGVHLNARGYRLWASRITAHLTAR
ncbi:hypothetical protein DKT77_08095 [Meridianimarinicoccus roseus]|uniref:SGNH hydrolase-type esterase domain-containing protein n=1 Tax=Meridianimarinicoccus roseus TaxID=2072018 RepID=A0A2V2LJ00_9RHOB|nr:GDSL-type esterase/lipase family protein [Meridianimarinicoccus roseus]PWR03166.1 hypothetical protein DKT77_08095 [Meridianimarinicoccus roseus]